MIPRSLASAGGLRQGSALSEGPWGGFLWSLISRSRFSFLSLGSEAFPSAGPWTIPPCPTIFRRSRAFPLRTILRRRPSSTPNPFMAITAPSPSSMAPNPFRSFMSIFTIRRASAAAIGTGPAIPIRALMPSRSRTAPITPTTKR